MRSLVLLLIASVPVLGFAQQLETNPPKFNFLPEADGIAVKFQGTKSSREVTGILGSFEVRCSLLYSDHDATGRVTRMDRQGGRGQECVTGKDGPLSGTGPLVHWAPENAHRAFIPDSPERTVTEARWSDQTSPASPSACGSEQRAQLLQAYQDEAVRTFVRSHFKAIKVVTLDNSSGAFPASKIKYGLESNEEPGVLIIRGIASNSKPADPQKPCANMLSKDQLVNTITSWATAAGSTSASDLAGN